MQRLSVVLVIEADVVVFEVARELGGSLVLEQALEPPPGGVAGLLTAALGQVQVFDHLVEIDVRIANDGLVCLFVLEFV